MSPLGTKACITNGKRRRHFLEGALAQSNAKGFQSYDLEVKDTSYSMGNCKRTHQGNIVGHLHCSSEDRKLRTPLNKKKKKKKKAVTPPPPIAHRHL